MAWRIFVLALVPFVGLAQELPSVSDGGFAAIGDTLAIPAADFDVNGAVNHGYQLDLETPFLHDKQLPATSFRPGRLTDWKVTKPEAFSMNPYAFDYKVKGAMASWGSGYVVGYNAHATLPSMFSTQSAGISATQYFGRFSITGGVDVRRHYLFNGMAMGSFPADRLPINFGVNGLLSYRVDERLSLNVYGQYYFNNVPFYSPASLPYFDTSRFGVYADMQFSEHFGAELGVGREYSLYSRQWQTVPVVSPYIKLNNGQKLRFDFGRLIGEIVDNAFNDGRYYGSGNATIGPPIEPMPPIR